MERNKTKTVSENKQDKNSKKNVVFLIIGIILLIISALDTILLIFALNTGRKNLLPLGIAEFILYAVAGTVFVIMSRKSKK